MKSRNVMSRLMLVDRSVNNLYRPIHLAILEEYFFLEATFKVELTCHVSNIHRYFGVERPTILIIFMAKSRHIRSFEIFIQRVVSDSILLLIVTISDIFVK